MNGEDAQILAKLEREVESWLNKKYGSNKRVKDCTVTSIAGRSNRTVVGKKVSN